MVFEVLEALDNIKRRSAGLELIVVKQVREALIDELEMGLDE